MVTRGEGRRREGDATMKRYITLDNGDKYLIRHPTATADDLRRHYQEFKAKNAGTTCSFRGFIVGFGKVHVCVNRNRVKA